MKVANVQIQLNEIDKTPSTVEIQRDVIKRAFERSWTERKIIYVYKK